MGAKNQLSKRGLSRKYDELYAAAERILQKRNPCKFIEGRCSANDVCCIECRHLSAKGCRVKAISCKLWLCDSARRRLPACARQLDELITIAKGFGFLGYRETKQEVIERVIAKKRSPEESEYW